MNQFMMGMLAIAATAFTSCSNEDGLGNDRTSRESVENFYMKLQITGNDASTRSVNDNPTDGTKEESTIKSGTIWLVAPDGSVAFAKTFDAIEWAGAWNGETNTGRTKTIKVAVTQVHEKTKYKVYFLANKTTDFKLMVNPTLQEFTSSTGGADFAKDNAFVMFNQNDKDVKADQYIVEFKPENKNEDTPASPDNAIKLDRLTARIDKPESTSTINKDAKKNDKTVNIESITAVNFLGFATSNMANETNIEQKWETTKWETLLLPTITYYWDKDSYGTPQLAKNLERFSDKKQYLFEQTTTNGDNATSIYLQYEAILAETANKDFTDGTFYRYDKHIFTSIEDIIKFAGFANPFGKDAADVVKEIKDADDATTVTTDPNKLAAFRTAYNIEVFAQGKVYYKYIIVDKHHTDYTILRNSIYRIDVKNIYDLGCDTPNGEDEEVKPNYYLDVEVSVNPWVLNNLNIDLK